MFIDTHCHIDLFDDPIATARAYEDCHTTCVMVTMLPSHYQASLPHLKSFRTVRPAMGLHPLRATAGIKEVELFKNLSHSVEYIGEIGLDYSSEGAKTKSTQLEILKSILPSIVTGKFISIHSRSAVGEISIALDECKVRPVCFHYFTGGPAAAERLANKGHYFSINRRMLEGKHRDIIDVIPVDKILAESDGPFLTLKPLIAVEQVYKELSILWDIPLVDVAHQLADNFKRCRSGSC